MCDAGLPACAHHHVPDVCTNIMFVVCVYHMYRYMFLYYVYVCVCNVYLGNRAVA